VKQLLRGDMEGQAADHAAKAILELLQSRISRFSTGEGARCSTSHN